MVTSGFVQQQITSRDACEQLCQLDQGRVGGVLGLVTRRAVRVTAGDPVPCRLRTRALHTQQIESGRRP
jgi:hypothetical protein